MKKIIFFVLLLNSFSLTAQEITENSFGNGIVNIEARDSSFSLKFGARFQSLYTSTWSGTNELQHQQTSFLIRRARLKFDGFAYSPRLEYKLELALSNRDISGGSAFTHNADRVVLDAVLKWNFAGNFELWGGQTKLPGNRERVISSGDLQFVDRSLLNSQFNIDRDMGIQLHHSFTLGENFIVTEALAVSQGEGRNVTTGNIGKGMQWTARAEIYPFGKFKKKGAYVGSDIYREETVKAAIGFTYNFNDEAVRSRSNLGSYMETDYGFFGSDIETYFIDAMVKYQGFSFMGEYAYRSADSTRALNSDGSEAGAIVNTGVGLNLQGGYLFPNNYEIAFRYTTINLNELSGYVDEQYTIGLSKYIVGHKLKVQTDLSFGDVSESNVNNLLYRIQFDFHL